MTVVCKPVVMLPEFVVTQEQTQELGRRLYAGHPHLEQILSMVRNTGVQKRYLIRPVDECIEHTGFTHRNQLFEEHAKNYLPDLVSQALQQSGLQAEDISLVTLVSCTGFMMPSLTAWLINHMGMRPDTKQLPIAQLGCAAGAAALNGAADYCDLRPQSNALVVAVEFCSLCYQPSDTDIGSLISNGLFGDALAAAVLRGDNRGQGLLLHDRTSHLIRGTESWISYEVRETGFHFRLNKGVATVIRKSMPTISNFIARQGQSLASLDQYAVHTGGPRILDSLHTHGGVSPYALRLSRESLEDHGNIASASVFATLARIADSSPSQGDRTLVAGFGPGITMELAYGTWCADGAGAPRADDGKGGEPYGVRQVLR
ncbi:1,3,6,8-tetrahydroxynaphthalene synthase [Streptomyces sp. V4I8]|uniref:type III polyketide synthase n=1 Tax=Streptomyces sp. V4I8 TaxID=3156469 RepID=UPI0035164AB4